MLVSLTSLNRGLYCMMGTSYCFSNVLEKQCTGEGKSLPLSCPSPGSYKFPRGCLLLGCWGGVWAATSHLQTSGSSQEQGIYFSKDSWVKLMSFFQATLLAQPSLSIQLMILFSRTFFFCLLPFRMPDFREGMWVSKISGEISSSKE